MRRKIKTSSLNNPAILTLFITSVQRTENEIIISVGLGSLWRSWACSAIEDNDDDEKWIASICPIETILTLCLEFLLIRQPSFSILLYHSHSLSLSFYFLPMVFLFTFIPSLCQPGNQFEQVRCNDISFGMRRRENRRATFFLGFLCTVA